MNRRTKNSASRALSLIIVLEVLFASSLFGNEPVRFDQDIAPLFKRHCVKCHGPVKQESNLNLATTNGIVRGGKGGASVVPHDAAASLIWQRIDADEMPPDAPLSAAEKSLVKRWIVDGTSGLTRTDADDKDHWAFRPLNPSLWKIDDSSIHNLSNAATTPVDRFLLANLAKDHLSFLPEADRYQLIRRVSFDLIGLPPSSVAIEEYLTDSSPDAYSKMVDRYLASPHFGERIGKIWLDAAGYADSNGYFNADSDRPLAYRYRDYVIRSLNADKSFAEFIREQIAGDELSNLKAQMGASVVLPSTSHNDLEAASRVIELWEATHFLRNGQDGTGESDGNDDEVRVDRYTVIETAMQNISTSLLGLTIQCAKCHDHKFEPLTQRDYYSFQAVLIPVFPPQHWKKPNDRFVYASLQNELESWQKRVAEIEANVTALQSEVNAWTQLHRPHGTIVFEDHFDGAGETLQNGWSHTAPGDDAPGGTVAVNLNSQHAPAANIADGRLQIIEGGSDGDKWLCTKSAFDWTPDVVGASIQVTFDLIDNHISSSAAAERIGYFIAAHDFHNKKEATGGDILIDGNPSKGTSVHLDYPGSRSKHAGEIGKTGYVPGKNYGVRVTNLGDGKFQLQQLVDWLVDDPSINLKAADLPNGGFGFEFCCGRSFVVDNVVVETFTPHDGIDPIKDFVKEVASRRQPLDDAKKSLAGLKGAKPGKISWTTDVVDQPPQVHVLERGNYATPGEPVEPAGFAILGGAASSSASTSQGLAQNPNNSETKFPGRRLKFANWLTQPDSKPASLMARVQVNRLWHHLFGSGLVTSVDNFGLSGPPPSNLEALDFLAAEFILSGWSTKHIVRLIVNSAAYRQASQQSPAPSAVYETQDRGTRSQDDRLQLDPDARRLSRFPVRRLDAEAIRDMLLYASGDLDDRLFGPYIPTSRTGNGETVVPEENPGARRRSIYLQQKRTQVHSFLQVFDAPSIVFNSTRRPRSTMPLQSLSLLNSDFVAARAQHLARRLEEREVSDSGRLQRAFIKTTGHPPTDADISAATRFLHDQTQEYPGQTDAVSRAWTDLCQMLLIENASLYID